jgi:hypothetical protein
MTLADFQYQWGSLLLGDGTDYYVQRVLTPGHRVRFSDADRPDGPGVFFGQEWPDASDWTLDVRISGSSPTDALSKYETLAAGWSSRGTEGALGSAALVFKRPGQVQRRTSPGRPRDLRVDTSRLRKTHVIDCQLTFGAELPFEYSDTEYVTDLVVNPTTPAPNVTLGNAGNYPASVVWDVYGEVTNPGVIRAEADRFDLTTAIGDLDYYRVRTEAKTVTRASDGHSLYQTFTGTFLEIPAGGALFRAVGSAPVTAAVKVRATWRDTWWS